MENTVQYKIFKERGDIIQFGAPNEIHIPSEKLDRISGNISLSNSELTKRFMQEPFIELNITYGRLHEANGHPETMRNHVWSLIEKEAGIHSIDVEYLKNETSKSYGNNKGKPLASLYDALRDAEKFQAGIYLAQFDVGKRKPYNQLFAVKNEDGALNKSNFKDFFYQLTDESKRDKNLDAIMENGVVLDVSPRGSLTGVKGALYGKMDDHKLHKYNPHSH